LPRVEKFFKQVSHLWSSFVVEFLAATFLFLLLFPPVALVPMMMGSGGTGGTGGTGGMGCCGAGG
jgi:hypothetical protein